MSPRTLSNESGSPTGLKTFFSEYLPALEARVECNNRELVLRSQNLNNHQVNSKDPIICELEMIHKEFEQKSAYSKKLARIMLDGLKNDFVDIYRSFITGRLPATYIPIIRMNNINTPYIEFLLKSGQADQSPESQLSDFKTIHLAYSRVLVDKLLETVAPEQSTPKKQMISRPKQLTSQPKQLTLQTKQLTSQPKQELSPGHNFVSLKKRGNKVASRQEPKRVLPERRCKSGNSSCRF